MEKLAHLRIKFASIDERGYVGDSHEEYNEIFIKLPSGWTCKDTGLIETRREGSRRSWLLKCDEVVLGAVEHETGLEILAINVATGLVTAALLGLAGFLWKKWNSLRAGKPNKVTSSLELEYETRLSDGSTRRVRISYSGPLDQNQINDLLVAATAEAYNIPDSEDQF